MICSKIRTAGVLVTVMACFIVCLYGNISLAAEEDGAELERITASYTGSRVSKGDEIDLEDIRVRAYYSDDR